MARVDITLPDDLHREAQDAGLNVSHLAQRAIVAALSRLARIAELDAYLAELEAELGPITGDPGDLQSLAGHATNDVRVAGASP